VHWGQALVLAADSPGSKGILVYHNRRILGRIPGERGRLRIDEKLLGLGPVCLAVAGLGEGGVTSHVFAPPIWIDVKPPPAIPAISSIVGERLADGIRLARADGKTTTVLSTRPSDWLSKAGVKRNEPFMLTSYFRVPAKAEYQFQALLAGNLDITVDGLPVFRGRSDKTLLHYVPVPLDAGWHRFQIDGKVTNVRLRLYFGGRGTRSLDGKSFKHRP